MGRTCYAQSYLCSDLFVFEVPHQRIDSAEFEVSPVDQPDPFGFVFYYRNLAVLHRIPEGQGTANPTLNVLLSFAQFEREVTSERPTINTDYFLMVVAVLGTTISPYLFFWQASQEVEEMNQGKIRRPLRDLSRGGHGEIDRIKLDTIVGMIFSNVIAFFIILTTAAVLNAGGITNINSATQAAEALRPLAGNLTFFLFALGIIGTGMLAIPVLAGSAAYGVAEAFGWHATLEAKAPDAVGFYAIIAAATVIGFGLGFTGIDAIHMLVWSAVLNGIVAVPIMAMMMVIVGNSRLMGRFRAKPWLIGFGWVGTGLMAFAVVALLWSSLVALS